MRHMSGIFREHFASHKVNMKIKIHVIDASSVAPFIAKYASRIVAMIKRQRTRKPPARCELKEEDILSGCEAKPTHAVRFADLSPIFVCAQHATFFQHKWRTYGERVVTTILQSRSAFVRGFTNGWAIALLVGYPIVAVSLAYHQHYDMVGGVVALWIITVAIVRRLWRLNAK